MKTVLVTGAEGFIGKNLINRLSRLTDTSVLKYDIADPSDVLSTSLDAADVIFHLAGVNRPQREEDFAAVNRDLTEQIVAHLLSGRTRPILVLSSSIQAELRNPYGQSKRQAEIAIERYGSEGGSGMIFRLPNVFGKWSRPNYNSAVATFCYNIARGLDVSISDPDRILELVYIDDVVKAFTALLVEESEPGTRYVSVQPSTKIALKDLVAELHRMRSIRTRLELPDMSNYFCKCLYATYLSFLPGDEFDYALTKREDSRGTLAELLKTPTFGQLFISRTKPGITRGNHYHDTKVEKFCVVEGEGIIRFRQVLGKEILSYDVKGEDFRVVDIPPGYTHSIENIGSRDLVVLFWSSEIFDPSVPDTYPDLVIEK